MTVMLTSLAGLCALVTAAVAAAVITGLQQPSRRIVRHGRVVFAALRQNKPTALPLFAGALWASSSLFTLIGEDDTYWTDYLILKPDARAVAELQTQPGLSDLFVAEVELISVPALVLGLLRLQHLLGLSRRPAGPVPTAIDHVDGRPEILPTSESIMQARSLDPDMPVTMMNFLEYHAVAKGDAADGRAAYIRYGRQAFRAVHAVGGQFLFAGMITAVLVRPHSPDWRGPWDDVAAMIYPDPTAIFAMEQIPAYRRALSERDAGLRRTRVIATEDY